MIRALAIIIVSAFLSLPCAAAEIAPAPMDLSGLRAKAEAGEPAFQAYFGYLYLNGSAGLPQDYEKAFGWYHKAADQGYVAAQYNLGILYDEGLGVTQSHEAGYFWLTLAAQASGKLDYAERRDKAGYTLSLARMDELKKRAAAWKPSVARQAVPSSAAIPAAPVVKLMVPGTPVPWFKVPPAVQKTVNDNVGAGSMIGKIDRAVEDGVTVYRAQINKPGGPTDLVRVTEGGKLVNVSKMAP
ncbi:MAG: tetratricopeptide repeat protein [Alphaproteobacteria bacterium]